MNKRMAHTAGMCWLSFLSPSFSFSSSSSSSPSYSAADARMRRDVFRFPPHTDAEAVEYPSGAGDTVRSSSCLDIISVAKHIVRSLITKCPGKETRPPNANEGHLFILVFRGQGGGRGVREGNTKGHLRLRVGWTLFRHISSNPGSDFTF
ncbi:uncharacterized protein F4812DRAFT_313913 [Daldinia caldariorum]|uniref:uncharacterized protein n=1 Tax=Daldinia caldariorum TaxID=326644 RepID=UPI0020081357|nr:uncharacterized protein F4812DRAFT_313913 [Daldinia caldariorum]KAI1470095.1 hypothetical protein F4812DRAFT_313913 [Daldinia caldariorum]